MTEERRNAVVAGQWMISGNGQQHGPFSLDQMTQMIREGRMPAGVLAWTPGMSEWKPWRQVPEFELMGIGGGWAGPLRQASKGQVVDYLVFRRMILPIVIQVVFWLGLVMIALGSLRFFLMAWGAARGFGECLTTVLMFSFVLIVSVLMWRCLCEVIILFYRINETLTDVKNAVEKQGG
jgi:hypothetical protein